MEGMARQVDDVHTKNLQTKFDGWRWWMNAMDNAVDGEV